MNLDVVKDKDESSESKEKITPDDILTLMEKQKVQEKNKLGLSELDKMFYENANKYRLHQDVLRWSLLAGYGAFFGVCISLLTKPEIINNQRLLLALSILFFFTGTCYLLFLAFENWFYNLFADYVRDCEERLVNEVGLRSLKEFGQEKGAQTNPFHPSFFFVLMLTCFGNSLFLIIGLLFSFAPAGTHISFGKLIYTIIFVFAHFLFWHFIFKRWNKYVYEPLIKPFQRLYKP